MLFCKAVCFGNTSNLRAMCSFGRSTNGLELTSGNANVTCEIGRETEVVGRNLLCDQGLNSGLVVFELARTFRRYDKPKVATKFMQLSLGLSASSGCAGYEYGGESEAHESFLVKHFDKDNISHDLYAVQKVGAA